MVSRAKGETGGVSSGGSQHEALHLRPSNPEPNPQIFQASIQTVTLNLSNKIRFPRGGLGVAGFGVSAEL